ncbi:MAG: response regulator [Pyrinomonadaceae bacterium]|nr:response regulator [Pyrinomonadaceae bacterium]
MLQTVEQLLQHEGWQVVVCRDGADGLKQIESGQHYDLIILDRNLPNEDGLELLRRARSLDHRRSTPIIVFTASDSEREALAAGADAFLRKPGGINELNFAVKLLLMKYNLAGELS